jgi:arylsulfatase A-like enzyme
MKVLVLTARGLQLGLIGCYGNLWVGTPSLDALAAEGIAFDSHLADAADPAGARRAWRSGRYHFPPAPDTTAPPAADGPDLIASLREQGVYTCLIVDDSREAHAGFEAGWDEVRRGTPADGATPLESTLEAAHAALEGLAGRDRWLVWVDLATPLPPWDVPEEFLTPYFEDEPAEEDNDEDEEAAEDEVGEEGDELDEEEEPLTPVTDVAPGPIDAEDDTLYLSLQSTCAAAVSYLDAGIGDLLEALRALDEKGEVLVLVTGDRGQALGEHGMVGPVRPWLHDEVLHLPLLVRMPGAAEAGRRVPALTQNVDVAPTLADLFGVPLPGAHGHSLMPLIRGEAEEVRAYACAGVAVEGGVEWCLRTPEWSLLLPLQPHPEDGGRGPQLYVKPDDRWEVNNVLQHHLDLADSLEQTLRTFVSATLRPGPLQAPPLPDAGAAATTENAAT